MSVALAVRDGKPCLELPDHRGRVHQYAFEVVANTPQRFSVRLLKLDAEGATYLVQVGERWHACDCPTFRYRRDIRPEGCKHVHAAKDLRVLLAAMVGRTLTQV